MGVKLGSLVMILMVFFIAKVSFEGATANNSHDVAKINDRAPASIDHSYHEHLNNRH